MGAGRRRQSHRPAPSKNTVKRRIAAVADDTLTSRTRLLSAEAKVLALMLPFGRLKYRRDAVADAYIRPVMSSAVGGEDGIENNVLKRRHGLQRGMSSTRLAERNNIVHHAD